MKYDLTKPCPNCPFRNDKPGYLAPGRPKEIAEAILRGGEFPCHKTTKFEDGEGEPERVRQEDEQACAGMLILAERDGGPNQMMRICERLGMYDPSKLDTSAPVYKTWAEFGKGAVEPRRKKTGGKKKAKEKEGGA